MVSFQFQKMDAYTLQRNWAFIQEHVRVEPVVEHLFNDGHITYNEKTVLVSEPRAKAAEKLLDTVYHKPNIYEGFLKALKTSRQEAIVARLETDGNTAIRGNVIISRKAKKHFSFSNLEIHAKYNDLNIVSLYFQI